MELVLSALTGILLALLIPVIGFFLKKIHDKVEGSSSDINDIKLKMACLGAEFSKSITDAFNSLCKERQDHCYRLHEARFKALEVSDQLNCNKIAKLEADRKENWVEQRAWNRRIEKFFETHNRRADKPDDDTDMSSN
jgi:hypothetical protein